MITFLPLLLLGGGAVDDVNTHRPGRPGLSVTAWVRRVPAVLRLSGGFCSVSHAPPPPCAAAVQQLIRVLRATAWWATGGAQSILDLVTSC